MSQGLLPDHVRLHLQTAGIDCTTIHLAGESDVDEHANYGTQWLIITDQRLVILSATGAVRSNLALKSITKSHVESMVGSSRIEVVSLGEHLALIQFTQARAPFFVRASRWLESYARDGKAPEQQEKVEEAARCATCGLLLPEATKVCPRCLNRGHVLRRLLQAVLPYRWRIALIMAFLVLMTVVEMAPPLLTRTLVDRVLQPPGDEDQLLKLVLGLLALRTLHMGLGIAGMRLTNRVGSLLVTDLRSQIFRKLQEMSVRYYDRAQVGALMTRVGQDTEELRIFITHLTQGVLQQLMLLGFIGVTLFALSPGLGLFVLIPAPIVLFGTARFWKYVMPHIHRYWAERSALNATLNAVFSGVRVVKSFAQEPREIARFDERNLRLFEARKALDHAWMTFSPSVAYLFSLGGFLVWYFGGRQVIRGFSATGADTVTLGTLLAFIAYLAMFYAPLQTLSGVSDWLTRSLTAAQRIFEILDQPVEVEDAPDAIQLPTVRGELEWERVCFGYDRANPIIHDVSFKVNAGEMIGVVGRSGAGKTTLMNLLCRFYDVTDGCIKVDGHDVRRILTRDLRRHIGMVLQEPFLFRGTILENISYARPGATREDVLAAARAANANDFIVRMPEGYDTRLGERGAGLSGGERQRVSIARAILHNPAILILDEATSSVDTETEKLIQDALAELVRGRTTFAIAHRLSTLAGADRILVIDKGRVAEMGTPAELMEKKGIYHRLVTIQDRMARGGHKNLTLDDVMKEAAA